MEGKKQLLVLGLDGASFPCVREWLAAGWLPNLQQVLAGGALHPLPSTHIILTPVAWSTSYTGRNPARHGICGFTRQRPGTYLWDYVSPGERVGKEYWRLLSDQGYRSIVVGPVFCQNCRDFDGIFVGGEYCGSIEHNVYPDELRRQVIDEFGYQPVSQCRTLEETGRFMATKFRLASHLLRSQPWDLGFVGFMEPDLLHHRNDLDFTRQGFQLFDRLLGEFLAQLPEDLSILIYSDHGHQLVSRAFHVNSWLHANGLLAKRSAWDTCKFRWQEMRTGMRRLNHKLDSPVERAFFSALYGGRTLVRSLPALHRTFMRFFPEASLPDKARPMVFGEQFEAGAQVAAVDPGALLDYGQTTAFAYLNRGGNIAGLCINREGQYPQGKVSAAEYQQVREHLIEMLGQIREPLDGGLLVKQVWRREEVFSGDFVHQFPDLLFEIDERYFTYISEDNISRGNQFLELRDSQHARIGLLGCAGPAFAGGTPEDPLSLMDIAPTVLYALGARIPDDLDGRLPLDLFSAEHRAAHAVEFYHDSAELPAAVTPGYSPEEEQAIARRLRDLGYLE